MKRKMFVGGLLIALVCITAKFAGINDLLSTTSTLLENAEALTGTEGPDDWEIGKSMDEIRKEVGTIRDCFTLPDGTHRCYDIPKYEKIKCCVPANNDSACNNGDADTRC